ncbi:MAG TPA: class I SAM-dependent methyltransferase [Polyangiaceae bacterium]|jgi:SAM-dependent methyltransferase|nr:class I SAM-dependent methyltransferase [Polyangiaceae bacterium]
MGAEQAWTSSAGRAWVKLQDQTDAQFEEIGNLAIDKLAPARAEAIIDIGAGTGQTTLALARQVGEEGRVVAIDISEAMVEAARARIERAQVKNVEVVLGNAADLHYEAQFDAIYSRFGVMFFSDSAAAFASLQKSLKPAGRIAFVCWQPLEVNDWARVPIEAVHSVVPDQPLPELLRPGTPGPFYFSDPVFIQRLLKDAGFKRIQIEPHTTRLRFGAAADVAQAVDYALQIGPSARMLAEADPAVTPRVREALFSALSPYASDSGVWMNARTLVVSAFAT